MANRDEILRELIVEEIRCAIENGTINIKDLLRYDQDFVFSDPRDIPSLGYVESLIGTGGSTIVYRVFLIPASDITDGPVNLTGRTNEQGDTVIPSNANQTIYELGLNGKADIWVKSNAQFDEDNEVTGLDGSLDVKIVLIGGEPVAPGIFSIQNISSQTVQFSFNTTPYEFTNINPGDPIIQSEFNVFEYIDLNIVSGVSMVLKTVYEDGSEYTDPAVDGPLITRVLLDNKYNSYYITFE